MKAWALVVVALAFARAVWAFCGAAQSEEKFDRAASIIAALVEFTVAIFGVVLLIGGAR